MISGMMISFIFLVRKNAFMLVWLNMIKVLTSANTTFSVIPSSIVEVNQVVTLQCIISNHNPNAPLVVFFGPSQKNSLCQLEPSNNGTCKNTTASCSFLYNATCLNESKFDVQVTVTRSWNKRIIGCSTFTGNSSVVTFFVKVPVAVVTMNLTTTSVNAGQEININCITSYCDPPANITWFTSSVDNTSQYTYKNEPNDDGLIRTKSSLQRNATKKDNGMMVYCSASNIPSRDVNSTVQILTVFYKPELATSTPNPYRVKEGQPATLECRLTAANPNTSIIWKWFKTTFSSHPLSIGPNFTIPGVTKNNSGSYNCTASNTVGTSEAVTINLDVQYKPIVISSTENPKLVTEGQLAIMECKITEANPNINIRWEWFRKNFPNDKLSNLPEFRISNITRDRTGSYICIATNSVGASDAVTINLDVLYKPNVTSSTHNPYRVTEGQSTTMECRVIDAKPKTGITWKWFNTTSPSKTFYNGSIFTIPVIKRENSGSYSCTASNSAGTSEAVTIKLDVQYPPTIRVDRLSIRVNESDKVIIFGEIVSNPLADIAWYSESVLLKNESSVTNTTYEKDNAKCTDTRNFTIVASNTVETNVTAAVELIVNCKPQIYDKNITLGVTDTTGIEFSIEVIAYPEPDYEVKFENVTNNNQMMASITRNAVNNFTIRVNQTDVQNSDYGVYRLVLSNSYGNATVFVNVIPQRKPDMPTIIYYICEVKSARIQWKSSFNGGDPQSFTVVVLHGNQIENKTDTISDRGENEIHATFVENLQSSTTYVFSVSTHNKHGFTLSKNISCTTLKDEGINLPLTAGAAAAGGITFAIIVIVVVVMFRRYTKNEERPGKPQRLEDELIENRDTDDDGLKENILYVSADTRDFEKPEPAVYAAVDKKSQETKSKANVYAEVNKSEQKFGEAALYSDVKPKKGFFKKDEKPKLGGKPKQRKEKKQKIKQEVADVYENSEDIAMTATVDNVYSNSDHKHQPGKGQRGYKNKDGLLYVEVNFDGKQGQDNPVIHGEDEKTDYATVEFPMSSSVHKASGGEEL